ncbi:MAG: PLP-dependent transferase [Proteobacteria bacterium]|nr:MAG: PLP-dependent transferase [Pseudomonadota bacterium]MBC6944535.1 PLP-dependent transferase [Gammaproteobacteria bacterium]MCE7896526.1 PLP-dependent transferase [Gammaproteobacteria bacterium PRO8]MCL4776497.1 PLP-dependent aspartate aminotransferase family protein [Gammaproteobacteria bacterium]MDL1880969.1 PLP-dependent transferase [Gammaproteobacteria bacterium PRO2]
MGFNTRQIHAGVTPDPVTGAILTPIYQTTTYVQDSVDEYLAKGYSYSRSSNPTVRALEQKLANLEGGADATCYGTGMAALQAVYLAFLNAGDHAIVSDVVYGGTYRLSTKVFSRFGVSFSFVDTSQPGQLRQSLRPNTRLILTESPANPTLKLTDIAAVSAIAREAGVLHAVDNTFLTPYYQRPLELGADLVVHSTTKYFDGHNATVGGAVVARTKELDQALRFVQNAAGMILSPQAAFLTLQGCKTLSVRLERQSANALAIARFLEGHPQVERVCYPGLESFPQHELARRQASGFGAMLWFEVKGGVAAGKALMDGIRVWSLAENLGSVESLITHPVTMTHGAVEPAERLRVGITDGLVRASVGMEDVEDLIGALDAALALTRR